MKRKIMLWIIVVLVAVPVALLGAWVAFGVFSTLGIEKPAYVLVEKRAGYEVRRYAPCIRAEVTLEGGYQDTLYGGFRQVAGYIFGDNESKAKVAMTAPVLHESSEKIAMTAPVLHEQSGAAGAYTVAFIMPKQYTLDTLPKPKNAKLQLREIPETVCAVRSFSGNATEQDVRREKAQLAAALERDGIRPTGDTVVAQYNPPWTPPFMRHNEIQAPLP